MVQYTITLSDAEDKALHIVAVSAQDWLDNIAHERCRVAIEEVVSHEVQLKLAAGESITGTKDDIVLASALPTAADREAAAQAEMAQGA